MPPTNRQLVQLMEEHGLSRADVAKKLNVAPELVGRWMVESSGSTLEIMPEAELRLLQYALMSENKRYHLF
jgi:transposase-like protein